MRGVRIKRVGGGLAQVTAPTHAWVLEGYMHADVDLGSDAATHRHSAAGRKLRTMTLHHSEISVVRRLADHLPPA